MERTTSKIVHMEVADSKETDMKSTRLERLLLERCLQALTSLKFPLSLLVTDASSTAITLLGVYMYLQMYRASYLCSETGVFQSGLWSS